MFLGPGVAVINRKGNLFWTHYEEGLVRKKENLFPILENPVWNEYT